MSKLDSADGIMASSDNESLWSTNSSWSIPYAVSGNGSGFSTDVEYSFSMQCLEFFNCYYLALVIVTGVVGNSLSFLVFTRTNLKLRSSSYYLAALALADLGFILTLLVVWLKHFDVDLFSWNGWCQAMVYGGSVCSCLSVWLTVAFTLERLIAVQYPLQRPSMCTVRRAKTIIFVLTFVAVASHTHLLFMAAPISHKDSNGSAKEEMHCELVADYQNVMEIVNLLDTILTLVIPVILIVSMNAMIAKNLYVFSRTFKKRESRSWSESFQGIQMQSSRFSNRDRASRKGSVARPSAVHSQNSLCNPLKTENQLNRSNPPFNGATHSPNTPINANEHDCLPVSGNLINSGENNQANKDEDGKAQVSTNNPKYNEIRQDKLHYRNILSIRTQYSITKMLLLISTVFISLNLPSHLMRLYIFIIDVLAHPVTEISPTVWLLQQFFMLLYYTNFSINFLLYSTCGTTFRHCLCRLIRGKIDTVRRGLWRNDN